MTHPVTRVLALLELLQARPGLTGPELADRLDVDERTVRRYAARLAELGIPVEAERGRYGGYRLCPGFKLPPLMLTDEEAMAVVLGLLLGRRSAVPAGAAAIEAALAKIQRVLPAALRERVAAVAQTVGVTGPAVPTPPPDARALLTLAEAARARRRVKLAYRSWRGAETERELDPYGLVCHADRWYVTGLDQLSGELRTFRLDRIRALEPLDTSFTEPGPPGFDPVAHVLDTLASAPWRYQVEVLLHTTPAEARRRIPSTVATLTVTDQGVLLSTRAERLDAMASMLAGLGWPCTVLHPAELRGELRALAARLTVWAENPPDGSQLSEERPIVGA
ncbi:helix-turn-helix transcriptional regulator [Kitasatospora azatica]|uniref:helix-turn-helix transcriptional regulator n=1 Tax=Kitasatospora azatica TaxID=58347 RepID=UPI00055B27C0|nr:YafY family protein [Kitasatospora azatica]